MIAFESQRERESQARGGDILTDSEKIEFLRQEVNALKEENLGLVEKTWKKAMNITKCIQASIDKDQRNWPPEARDNSIYATCRLIEAQLWSESEKARIDRLRKSMQDPIEVKK